MKIAITYLDIRLLSAIPKVILSSHLLFMETMLPSNTKMDTNEIWQWIPEKAINLIGDTKSNNINIR